MDDWQPQSLVEAPTELDELTLSSVPVIHGSNGVHVKLAPNGKNVRTLVQLQFPFFRHRQAEDQQADAERCSTWPRPTGLVSSRMTR